MPSISKMRVSGTDYDIKDASLTTKVDKTALLTVNTPLNSTDDLNMITKTGTWYANSNSDSSSNNIPANWPDENQGGRLIVFSIASDTTAVSQTFQMVIARSTGEMWYRMGASSWGDWKKVIDKDSIPDFYGTLIGSESDLDTFTTTGTWHTNGTGTTNLPIHWPNYNDHGRLIVFSLPGSILRAVQIVALRYSGMMYWRVGKTTTTWGNWKRIGETDVIDEVKRYFIRSKTNILSGKNMNANGGFTDSANATSNVLVVKVRPGSIIRRIKLGETSQSLYYAFYKDEPTETTTTSISKRIKADSLYLEDLEVPSTANWIGILYNYADFPIVDILDDVEDLQPVISEYVSSSLAMFSDIGVVGDSFTAGYLYNKPVEWISGQPKKSDDSYVPDGVYSDISWPTVMSRIYGTNIANYAKSGATTKSFILDMNSPNACLHKLVADAETNPKQLYILCLGLNDHTKRDEIGQGTIDDIIADGIPVSIEKDAEGKIVMPDYVPATSFGYYSYIIRIIQSFKTGTEPYRRSPKIILCKSFWILNKNHSVNNYYPDISDIVEGLSDNMPITITTPLGEEKTVHIPYIETLNDPFFCGAPYADGVNGHGFHPTAPLYAGMAKRLGQLIDKCIYDNPDYFFDYYPRSNA